MKLHEEPKNNQLFSENVKSGQKLNIMYGCHADQNGTLWDGPIIIYCIDCGDW